MYIRKELIRYVGLLHIIPQEVLISCLDSLGLYFTCVGVRYMRCLIPKVASWYEQVRKHVVFL